MPSSLYTPLVEPKSSIDTFYLQCSIITILMFYTKYSNTVASTDSLPSTQFPGFVNMGLNRVGDGYQCSLTSSL